MKSDGFLGIDVSKGYADFLLLDQPKNVLEQPFQLDDTGEGRKQLRVLIEEWFLKGIKTLYCGVESTGGYENNWYNFIKGLSKEFNIHVARLNPRGVKAVSDAALKRTITDAVSAENIAVYLISFPEKIQYGSSQAIHSDSAFREGRQHYTYVRMLQKQKVQLVNQLEKLLYQYFGEMLIYCRHGIPTWLLSMLSRYPCAASIRKAGQTRLTTIRGISVAKAEALMQKSMKSEQIAGKQIQRVIAMTSKEILHKEELLKGEKQYLIEQYQEHEDVKLMQSIVGIGAGSATGLMLEIETVKRFAKCKKFVANFGIHPTFKQSGDGVWGSHLSKKGPGEVRSILYMAALCGIRCNPILKPLYARFRAKGMKHYQAMGVVMHKLLRIIYGVLVNKTPFDPAVDKKNTERSIEKQVEKQKQIKETQTRQKQVKYRYQPENDQAPISRIQVQKRKKQAASQTS